MNDSIIPVYSQRSSDNQYETLYRSIPVNGTQSVSPIEDTYRASYNTVPKKNPPEASAKNSDPISVALGDATLRKIFNNKDILAIYEKMSKSEPLTPDENSRLIRFRDDEDIVNTSINQYLDFKKSIYSNLASSADTETFIKSWQALDQLPIEVKNSILSDLKGKLGDKLQGKGFDIDTVLKFDASTLNGNTAITEAISKSFKELADDQNFLKKFEDNKQVGSLQSIASKGVALGVVSGVVGGGLAAAAAGGGLGAAFVAGVANCWNPLGWGLLAGVVIGCGIEACKNNSEFGEGLESVGDAIGGFFKGVVA
jgi:hypothetical protein